MEEAAASAAPQEAAPTTPAPQESATPVPEAGDDVQLTPIAKDEGFDLLASDEPEWMRALNGMLEREEKSSFKVDQSAVDGLPIEAKQLLHNMRSKMLQTTQSNSDLRKQLESGLGDIKTQQEAIQQERIKIYSMFKDPRLAPLLQEPEGEQPDPFTKEGRRWLAKKDFAFYFKQFTDAINEMTEEGRIEIEKAAESKKMSVRVDSITAFINEHPDFAEHKAEIKKMVDDHGIPAEKAYHYVKYDKGLHKAEVDPVAEARAQSQRASSQGRSARPLVQGRPDGKNARELMDFYAKNPDLMKSDLEGFRKFGIGY